MKKKENSIDLTSWYHVWSDAVRTRRNPAHDWAFSSEDAMGKIGKVCNKSHGATIGRGGLRRWLIGFFTTLNDDVIVDADDSVADPLLPIAV